ncbi:hypothetical protein Angca_001826 [Angiostrongylus cantonensis]|nr:hypothetical protein Angca_001826 [Angiostrongylus cantonensis]
MELRRINSFLDNNKCIMELHRYAGDAGADVKSADPLFPRSNSTPSQPTTQIAWASSSANSVSNTKTSSLLSQKTTYPATSLDSALPSVQLNDVIASLPNCVVDSARRPSTHEGVNYRPVAKAPGDVSMSRQQIILCLSMASEKLSPVFFVFSSYTDFTNVTYFFVDTFKNIYRGVQLRISELNEAIDEGRISERCLKSLNYVVDAIDRANYDDAHRFFDRMRLEFPEEMGPWAQQGIRLLINELRRPTPRIGSAGSSIRM